MTYQPEDVVQNIILQILKFYFIFRLRMANFETNLREESFELVELNKIMIGHRLLHSIPSLLKYSVSFKIHSMPAEKTKPYRKNLKRALP